MQSSGHEFNSTQRLLPKYIYIFSLLRPQNILDLVLVLLKSYKILRLSVWDCGQGIDIMFISTQKAWCPQYDQQACHAKAKACAAKAAMAKARSKARQCCQGQGKASWHAEAKDKARHAKAKARLPGPRQCQPWPVYRLLGLENTIDEICKYGHPNPT